MAQTLPEDLQRTMQLSRRKALAFEHVMSAARSAVQSASGTDPSTAVTFHVGADGLPTHIELADGWRSRLQPTSLAQAVVEASRAARVAVMAAFLRVVADAPAGLAEVGLPPEPAMRCSADDGAPDSPAAAAVVGGPVGVRDAIRALDSSVAAGPVEPLSASEASTVGSRTSSSCPISFGFVGHHVVDCAIDPTWVQRYPSGRLAEELTTALLEQLPTGA